MKIAGTSPDYTGLYQAARNFSAPTAQKLAEASKKTLPEAVEVADMVEMMVAIDQRFDAIKAWAKSTGEKKGEAAANPLQESIQLRELVRESARLPVCNEKPAEFRRQFSLIESDISQLIDLLKSGEATDNSEKASKKAISTVIATITGRCTACHKAFRDK
jgi:cytochrome c556